MKKRLKGQKQKNLPRPFAPTWGVADSYSLLIQYYLENGDKAKANNVIDIVWVFNPASNLVSEKQNKNHHSTKKVWKLAEFTHLIGLNCTPL